MFELLGLVEIEAMLAEIGEESAEIKQDFVDIPDKLEECNKGQIVEIDGE